jgi:DNA repair exonuclease SbcCD nuclease subunit
MSWAVKIVHAADLHLDSPLVGLERYPSAPVEAIRGATRRAFEALMATCLEERAALLLIAGDVYDGDWKDYSTGLFFASQLARLREAGTRVVMVRGNHDAASQITRHLRLPEHVVELEHGRPATRVFEDLGVAVHGQSFAERAVREDLASRYPEPVRGAFNVGLLHTSVTGRPGHDDYAPCTADTLAARGYDYFALGHVHRREVLQTDPWIVFPGNLQGRHARETGPKGATVVEVRDGRVITAEARALDVVRWCVCELDASKASSADDVVDLARQMLARELDAAGHRTVAVRIIVRGATRAHPVLQSDPERWEAELRRAATELADELWIEKVVFRTEAELDVSALASRDDAIGQVARALFALRADAAARIDLASELSELRIKLPPEAREGVDGIHLEDPEFLGTALADVEQLLLPALAALGADE